MRPLLKGPGALDMSIIPDSDETLIVDQASVNGDGNGPLGGRRARG